MKTKKLFISMLCLGLTVNLMAQLPSINKEKLKMSKIKKEKKEETSTGNPEVSEQTTTTQTNSAEDDAKKTEMAYYFNDKNGELSALYNLTVGRYDQNGYFCRQVLQMNPQEVKKNIAECEQKWPDTYNEDFWVVSQFKPRIDEYATEMIAKQKGNFEKYQKECDAFIAQGNFVKANMVAKYMDSLTIAMAAFQPENADVKSLREKSGANLKTISSKLSVYHSSPFHTKNAGAILCSKNNIEKGKETDESMTATFAGSDNIFAAVYFEGRLKDYDDKEIYLRVEIEGVNYSISMLYPVTKENENESMLVIPVVSEPSQTKFQATANVVRMLAESAKAGENKINLTVLSKSQRYGVERGEIYKSTITLDASDMERIKKLNEEYYKIKVAAARIPAPVISNTTLEADAKKVSTGLFIGNVTPLRVTLQENWNVEYQYGSPIYRYLRAFVAIKDNNTGKCYYQMMKIGQDHMGGGKYGDTYLYDAAAPADLIEMECGNVNK